jgi:hypothetical protein
MGMPPSVAGSTLTHVFRQATKNRHFEQLGMQFPAGCCTNNTWRMGAEAAFFDRFSNSGSEPAPSAQPVDYEANFTHSQAWT